MTRDFIFEQISEIQRITGEGFETFYLRYTSSGGTGTSNLWGEKTKFEEALKKAENSNDCVGDTLPIELLVLITNRCVHCWTKNPLWSGVDYPDEDSHIYTNVPLVGRKWFVDPADWLDIDSREAKNYKDKRQI